MVEYDKLRTRILVLTANPKHITPEKVIEDIKVKD